MLLGLALGLAWLARGEPIRLLVPASPLRGSWNQAVSRVVDKFNSAHPDTPLQVLWRGSDFSSLNDLMVAAVTRDTPELAIVEQGEALTPELLSITKTRPIPFIAFQAILVMDQEILFRLRQPIEPSVNRLDPLVKIAETIAKGIEGPRMGVPDFSAVSVALQGTRGVLLLEALFGEAMDRPSSLRKEFETLRSLFSRSLARGGQTFEQALQSFTGRRSSFLLTLGDMQPHLRDEVYFRSRTTPLWNATSLPLGMALVTTRTSPTVVAARDYLLKAQQELAAAAGGLVPLKTPQLVPWRLRARAEWQRVLPDLFGDANQRLPLEGILEALEHRLQKLRKN